MKIKRIISCLILTSLILSLSLNLYFPVCAEENGIIGGLSTIINGSFEDPDLKTENPTLNWKNENKDNVLGWETTATDKAIEFGWMLNGQSPHMVSTTITNIISGEGASNGLQFAETVADEPSSLFQILPLSAGASYDWTIHHRGRSGVDTIALFIVEDAKIDYVKPSKESTCKDHFYQIVDWLKEQGITAPSAGTMAPPYTVYTTKMEEGSSFLEASDGSCFSFDEDGEHTVKFEIYLMSTDQAKWGEYTGTYFAETKKDVLFGIAPFFSSFTKGPTTGGNLLDNFRFLDSEGHNLLINAGFDDVKITTKYQNLKAANSASPTAGVGWCTTATSYYVEIGNLGAGNAYGLDIVMEETILNAPWIRDGQQFAELNSEQESSLYQIVKTESGKMYKWSLSHRGRSGLDTMALIIGPSQDYAPKKANDNKGARDQLMQIIDWLYSQTEIAVDIPTQGCSDKITVYSSTFNSNGRWTLNSNVFSWNRDADHTEEWSIWIISSMNDTWHDYGEIDAGATYNYEYIVPAGHDYSIFGFVSCNSTTATGVKNVTYGNLLDNISFKEYFYVDVNNPSNNNGGSGHISAEEDMFLFETDASGWAIANGQITVHIRKGNRSLIGTNVKGAYDPKDEWMFIPIEDWEYDETKKEYTYVFKNVSSAIQINIIYVAENIVYDSRSEHEYQHDGLNGGCEVKLGSPPLSAEYISHAPDIIDDGWRFIGWEYVRPSDSQSYLLEAVHKITLENDNTFSIHRILPNDDTELVVSNIPNAEGVTFSAQWHYRQRVVAKTFKDDVYEVGTDGGTVAINVLFGEADTKKDYIINEQRVGEELYASSDDTYVNAIAYNKIGYTFNGWYTASGELVSRNTSYTYKVKHGDVGELYAYFEPSGFDITVNSRVEENSSRYFAINCTFSGLRENKLYIIEGLYSGGITINGERVTNRSRIWADASGEATVTIYMKHGESAKFVYLPEDCVYSIEAADVGNDGYSVRGDVSGAVLKAPATVNLVYYKVSQSALLASGKHYTGILSGADAITVTKHSSFTVHFETRYTPGIYTGLYSTLRFYNSAGTAAAFTVGTRILMIDFTNANAPRYYQYTVPDSGTPINTIQIDGQFTELGSATPYEHGVGGSGAITEKLIFVVDYVGTAEDADSGKFSLVYHDGNGDDIRNAMATEKKTVNIGADTTQLTVTAGSEERVANTGPFTVNVKIDSSTPAVNTTYEDGLYAVNLSVDGGLPDGAYAEIGGVRYYSNNGSIKISPISAGAFTADLYSPVPIEPSSGEKVIVQTTLVPAVATAATSPAEISTAVEFNCVDVETCAIDADIPDKILDPGYILQVDVALEYLKIDEIRLTVRNKNAGATTDGTVVRDVNVGLPVDDRVTVYIGNGFYAVSGKTYIFSFVGYVDGVPVCRDDCCVVVGYQ